MLRNALISSLVLFLFLALSACRENDDPQTSPEQAIHTDALALALAQLDLAIASPWDFSITPAETDGYWVAGFSHRDNYLAVWRIGNDRTGRLVARADTEHHPDSIRWIDWDGDGKISEFVVTIEGAVKVQLWSFDGDDELELSAEVKLADPPRTVNVDDLDQDGHYDLILGPYDRQRFALLWGEQDFTFAAPQYIDTRRRPSYPVLVDWDKDQRKDIAWSEWTNTGGVKLALNQGARNFVTKELLESIPEHVSRRVRVGDLNGDDWPDLIAVFEVGKKAIIIYNDGRGGVAETEVIPAPVVGYNDAAVLGSGATALLALAAVNDIILAKRDAAGAWQYKHIPTYSSDLQFFDADNDGEQDLGFVLSRSIRIIYGPLWEKAADFTMPASSP